MNVKPVQNMAKQTEISADQDLYLEMEQAFREVWSVMMPVWPLKDYVAVNPYFGLADRPFLTARAYLRIFSDCETLMPVAYFASQYAKGNFNRKDISIAIQETELPSSLENLSADEIVELLRSTPESESITDQPAVNTERRIRTIAEHADVGSAIRWSDVVRDEISKICAAYYDQGQACWSSPHKSGTLFQAWRAAAEIDCNLEALGLRGVRRMVKQLPCSPGATIVYVMEKMSVPRALWSTILLAQAYSILGWCSFAKYQDEQASNGENLLGLLAIRLAYDLAISDGCSIAVNWRSYLEGNNATFKSVAGNANRDAWIRYILLRACEIRYRRSLLSKIVVKEANTNSNTIAQMVFCIDVRSERLRRQIERHSTEIQTLGFAGFFGVPMEYVSLGEDRPTSQLPVLLKPQFQVTEALCSNEALLESRIVRRRIEKRTWRSLWMAFQSCSASCFGFVETAGLLSLTSILQKSFLNIAGSKIHHRDGFGRTRNSEEFVRLMPAHNLSNGQQVELAANILKNMSLTDGFAKIVVLCGHHCQTENNPLAAGLDCGACGGHSGAPNSRMVALMLNQTEVRRGLHKRGIEIPTDTVFIAGVHNTTTDEIEFFDDVTLTSEQQRDFDYVRQICRQAGKATLQERSPVLHCSKASDLLKRAFDWSEVRPEWGLAGNAAFIIAPRSMTKHLDLSGSTFMHSYDASQDPEGTVLETIMTAPMIVTNWINMQYYASTVDNYHFGSGNKTLHNVVGHFGILSGNSGDLQTGLPWQSLHDGKEYRHSPMRLLVVIAAEQAVIERIIHKHELVYNLVTNGWLQIVATNDAGQFAFTSEGEWSELDESLIHDSLSSV